MALEWPSQANTGLIDVQIGTIVDRLGYSYTEKYSRLIRWAQFQQIYKISAKIDVFVILAHLALNSP